MKSIRIKFEPFPEQLRGRIKSFVINKNHGENYLIVIDSTRAPIVQRFLLGHELAHVFRGHFEKSISIGFAEKDADRHAWQYYRMYRDGLLEGVSA